MAVGVKPRRRMPLMGPGQASPSSATPPADAPAAAVIAAERLVENFKNDIGPSVEVLKSKFGEVESVARPLEKVSNDVDEVRTAFTSVYQLSDLRVR